MEGQLSKQKKAHVINQQAKTKLERVRQKKKKKVKLKGEKKCWSTEAQQSHKKIVSCKNTEMLLSPPQTNNTLAGMESERGASHTHMACAEHKIRQTENFYLEEPRTRH